MTDRADAAGSSTPANALTGHEADPDETVVESTTDAESSAVPSSARTASRRALPRQVDAPDARLLRRVRWRLVAWSALTTLVVLVVLGFVFYTVVAKAVEQGSIDQLYARADSLRHGRPDFDRNPGGAPLGAAFRGPGSGTYAVLVGPSGQVFVGPGSPEGLPVETGVAAARAGGDDIRTADASGLPVRILSQPVQLPDGTTVVMQIAQVITAERQTLQTLLVVLVGGGLLGLLAATLGGAAYASRALVPIRDSLRRQREFAADASHELRTPLAVVRSNVDYLQRHPELRLAEVGEPIDDVRDEVDRMTGLVEDLLLLARTDSGGIELEPSRLDLAEAAGEAVASLGPVAASRGVALRLDPAPTAIVGDRGRLRQLVRILVDNAIKHSPAGGSVRVGVRSRGAGAELVVEDDGPGIAPDDVPHLFERFWRAPGAPPGGSGLGLAIADWIVDRHRGTIEVTNREPHGARFEVKLPAGKA